MTTVIGGAWWEFNVMPGWNWREDEECLTVTKSDEGAFQISASVKTTGTITDEEVRDFLKDQAIQPIPLPASFGDFKGYEIGYLEDGVEWLKFWLANENIFVFVTYNGTRDALAREEQEIRKMLDTLRLREASKSVR